MTSVGIICAYFGKLQSSLDAWLRSCEFNPTIDFILLTDQPVQSTPNNVRVVRMTFAEVQTLVNEKMQSSVALERPYKLCDLKPMYGIIFEDLLRQYDYWGHCDMDMVFGDIRYYLDKYDLDKYDKFLNLGHLSLYRNSKENNLRFKQDGSKCGSWLEVITHGNGYAFDEINGIYQIFKTNQYPMFDKRIFADMTPIYRRFRCSQRDPNYDHQVFYWENGKVFRDYWINGEKEKEEFIYIHFQKRSFLNSFSPSFDIKTATSFFIGPSGFWKKDGPADINSVAAINPFRGHLYENIEWFFCRAKDYLKAIKRRLPIR